MSYLTEKKQVSNEEILSLIPPKIACTFANNRVKNLHDRRQKKCTNNLK